MLRFRAWNNAEEVFLYSDIGMVEFWAKSQGDEFEQVQMSTGAKDKNGNDIFQGDWLRVYSDHHLVEYITKMKTEYGHGESWNNIHIGFQFSFYNNGEKYVSEFMNNVQIIGHIHSMSEYQAQIAVKLMEEQ